MNLEDALKFWFGADPEIINNQELWFKISLKTDSLITEPTEYNESIFQYLYVR